MNEFTFNVPSFTTGPTLTTTYQPVSMFATLTQENMEAIRLMIREEVHKALHPESADEASKEE